MSIGSRWVGGAGTERRSKRRRRTGGWKSGRRRSTRVLCGERLDARLLLAGDVQAIVDRGSLRLFGDALDNEVTIGLNDAGDLVVTGQSDTTINGDTAPFVAVSGSNIVPRNLSVRMDAGNDVVRLRDALVARELRIGLGSGDDVLEVNGVSVLGASRVRLGRGNDLATLANATATNPWRLQGQQGNDTLVVGDATLSGRTLWGLGAGQDRLLVSGNAAIDGHGIVRSGAGDDFVGFLPADAGDTVSAHQLTVRLGRGSDQLVTDMETSVRRQVRVFGGRGSDVYQDDASFSDLVTRSIRLGTVEDQVTLIDAIFADLSSNDIETIDFTDDGQTDPPVVTTTGAETTFTEGDEPVTVDSGLTLVDEDSERLSSAEVQITGGFTEGDRLAATATGGITVGPFDASTGRLALSGDALLSDYETVLRSVTFVNDTDAVGNTDRVITFRVTDEADNTGNGESTVRAVDVNDAPVLDVSGGDVRFREGAGPVDVDPQLAVSDPDGDDLVGATVRIASGFQAESDRLTFTEEPGIAGVLEDNGQTLTFTGSASVEAYQRLLRSVAFQNTGDAPGTARTITLEVNDASLSATGEVTITIEPVDDPGDLQLPAEFSGDTIPVRTANVPFSFAVTLSDPDGTEDYLFQLDLEAATFSSEDNLPSIDAEGVFRWTPSTPGQFEIRILAVNGAGFVDAETFTIDIVV